MGLTETEAKAQGIEYEKAVFPWAASGRALGARARRGLHEAAVRAGDRRLLGAGIVGVGAGELIAETVLALEMGADAQDIGAHDPPAPDAVARRSRFAAEMADGTITDLLPPQKRRRQRPRAAGFAS